MRVELNAATRYAILAATVTVAACANEQPTDVDQAYGYLDNTAGAGATTNPNQTGVYADLLSQTGALLTPTSASDTEQDASTDTEQDASTNSDNIAPGSSISDAIEEGTATLTDLTNETSNLLSDLVDNNTGNIASAINTNGNVVGGAIDANATELPDLGEILGIGGSLPNIPGTTSLLNSNPVDDVINAGLGTLGNGVVTGGGSLISDLIGEAGDTVSDRVTTAATNTTSNVELTGDRAAQSANTLQTNLCANLPCLQSSDCPLATRWGCQVTSCTNNRCTP